MQIDTSVQIKALGECMVDIRVEDEAEVEEDLWEVRGKLFATIMECKDTTHESVQTLRACRVSTIRSLYY